MHILRFNELVDVPWKNGSGTTRNIAKGMCRDHVAWTISRADVAQNGPFSDFAGLKRVLTVVSGGAMTLNTPNISFEANLWEPVHFDGALKIQCTLKDGTLTDLNLMFDPHYCDGNVITRQGPNDHATDLPKLGVIAIHVLSGAPIINDTQLAIGDTAFIEEVGTALHLREGDALLEIRLEYLAQSDAIKLCIANR